MLHLRSLSVALLCSSLALGAPVIGPKQTGEQSFVKFVKENPSLLPVATSMALMGAASYRLGKMVGNMDGRSLERERMKAWFDYYYEPEGKIQKGRNPRPKDKRISTLKRLLKECVDRKADEWRKQNGVEDHIAATKQQELPWMGDCFEELVWSEDISAEEARQLKEVGDVEKDTPSAEGDSPRDEARSMLAVNMNGSRSSVPKFPGLIGGAVAGGGAVGGAIAAAASSLASKMTLPVPGIGGAGMGGLSLS